WVGVGVGGFWSFRSFGVGAGVTEGAANDAAGRARESCGPGGRADPGRPGRRRNFTTGTSARAGGGFSRRKPGRGEGAARAGACASGGGRAPGRGGRPPPGGGIRSGS